MIIIVTMWLLKVVLIFFVYTYIQVLHKCLRKVRVIEIRSLKKVNRDKLHVSTRRSDLNFQKQELRQAPGPLPWPILGNLALLRRYAVPFQGFTELAKQYGDMYTLTLGTTRCLIVNNLDLIREVLNENGKYFGGRPDFHRFHVLFGGDRNNSLALCDWSGLQQKRRNLSRKHCSPKNHSLYHKKMSDIGYFEMQEFLERLAGEIKHCGNIKLKPLLQQTCANMFMQYMCSVRFAYEDDEFKRMVRCFDEIFWEINQGYAVDFLPWLRPFYTDHFNKIMNWSTTIRKFILERIIEKRELVTDLEIPEKDFTDALLNSLFEDNKVSRDTILFMLEDFIGGHSAIGNLILLALAHIARSPKIGFNIQNEIDTLIGKTSHNVQLTDADHMPYTQATIMEVLRYSSSPIVPHVATEDVAIAGYGVTKGTIVFINNYELNTSSKYWINPQEFNPARFIEQTGLKKECSNESLTRLKKTIPHFLPFSIGKRTCVGQTLVRGFGFLMLANIMHKYNVGCSNVEALKISPATIAIPPEGFSLSLSPRENREF